MESIKKIKADYRKLVSFGAKWYYNVLARVIRCCDNVTTVCITSVFKMVDSIDKRMV